MMASNLLHAIKGYNNHQGSLKKRGEDQGTSPPESDHCIRTFSV